MNRLLTIFLTALFFVHVTFGCCLHHVHACDTACCETVGRKAPAATAEACLCLGHDKVRESAPADSVGSLVAGAQQPGHNPGHNSRQCEDAECHLALLHSSPATTLPNAGATPAVLTAAVLTATSSNAIALLASTYAELNSGVSVRGLRPHLFLAVLLI